MGTARVRCSCLHPSRVPARISAPARGRRRDELGTTLCTPRQRSGHDDEPGHVDGPALEEVARSGPPSRTQAQHAPRKTTMPRAAAARQPSLVAQRPGRQLQPEEALAAPTTTQKPRPSGSPPSRRSRRRETTTARRMRPVRGDREVEDHEMAATPPGTGLDGPRPCPLGPRPSGLPKCRLPAIRSAPPATMSADGSTSPSPLAASQAGHGVPGHGERGEDRQRREEHHGARHGHHGRGGGRGVGWGPLAIRW